MRATSVPSVRIATLNWSLEGVVKTTSPLGWLSKCSSLIWALASESSFQRVCTPDKHHDFTKHVRENLMTEFLTFAGKEEQRSLVSLSEEDLCSPPAPSIVGRTKEHCG